MPKCLLQFIFVKMPVLSVSNPNKLVMIVLTDSSFTNGGGQLRKYHKYKLNV